MSFGKIPGRFKISTRIIGGFAGVCLVLAVAVGFTIHTVAGVSQTVERMVGVRTPVALLSTGLVGNLYSTLATLRGYLLTGNPQGKADRAAMWKEVDRTRAEFDRMAEHFTNPENRRKWAEAKSILDEFRVAQDKAETVAFTPDAYPANKLLMTDATPRANLMFSEITKMIDEEEKLEATAERKALLKSMADTRGNLGLALANIRAYLLAGDVEFRNQFTIRWEAVDKAFAALEVRKGFLTTTQRAAFEAFAKARSEFATLPARMFEIRESAGWNVPVQLLVTEAAPRALRLLDLLDGPKQADGTRSGGIKTNQQQMLKVEAGEVIAGMTFLQVSQWALLLTGLAAGILIAFVTIRAIVRPLRGMTGSMTRLAGGDTTTEIPARDRRDEIGQMAKAVQVFKDSMIETERLRAEQKEVENRAEAEKRATMNKLADEFEASVKAIVQTASSSATELQTTAQSMSATAEQTSRQSTAVAAAAEQASSNVQTVASAAEELSSSVTEIGRQVAESTRIAGQAVEEANRTNAQVKMLADAAQKIGDVVKLINDIAGQTNLLALNATIEAARAGEAGKGFAVVASEVKSLANQTAKATDDIAGQVKAIQGATDDSVRAIESITGTISRVNEIATTIASAVEEQGAATQEIARNVQQASRGTSEVSANIAGVTQAAGETGAAASQVLGASGELAKQSETLRGQVDAFIAKVRSA